METIQFLMMGIELLQWKKCNSSNGKRITVTGNIYNFMMIIELIHRKPL